MYTSNLLEFVDNINFTVNIDNIQTDANAVTNFGAPGGTAGTTIQTRAGAAILLTKQVKSKVVLTMALRCSIQLQLITYPPLTRLQHSRPVGVVDTAYTVNQNTTETPTVTFIYPSTWIQMNGLVAPTVGQIVNGQALQGNVLNPAAGATDAS